MLRLGSALVPLNELAEANYIRETRQLCHLRTDGKTQTQSQVFYFPSQILRSNPKFPAYEPKRFKLERN